MLDTKAIAAVFAPIVKEHVAAATSPLLKRIEELEAREPVSGKAGEPGRDGVDGKDADMDALKAHLESLVAALPKPQDGKDGRDGIDGQSGRDADPVTDERLAAAVSAYFDANPVPTPLNGKDGIDGKDVAPEAIANMVTEAVERAMAAIPAPRDGRHGADGKDGVGLAGAIIDRAGELVITLTNGEVKSLGPVVGHDGTNGERGQAGFSLDDFDVSLKADGRTVEMSFDQGDKRFTRELALPTMIYRGVWQECREYERGDTVTLAGSLWHCEGGEAKGEWSGVTTEKPGDGSKSWVLAVKRGRDGKDFAGPQPKAPATVKI